MSGPVYPPVPVNNGIGSFEIGVSQIGTNPPFDVWKTIISQYANSPILTTLIENIFEYLDQTADFEAFFDLVWNVDTAQGHGLDIWGRIVNISRTIQVNVGEWFGFEEAGGDPFGVSSFAIGEGITDNYLLSDDAYRLLILAKAATNITNGSIPAINQILLSLFPGRGNCYVTEGTISTNWFGFQEAVNANGFNQQSFYSGQVLSTMSIQYVFMFALTPVELAIVSSSGALPKPTGVSASVVVI